MVFRSEIVFSQRSLSIRMAKSSITIKLIAYIVVMFSEIAPVGMGPLSWFRLKSLKSRVPQLSQGKSKQNYARIVGNHTYM